MERRGCLWVLVNLRIEIARTPKWQDRMIVRTWPSGCKRLVASREFAGRSPDGLELFRATSDWMILDKHSGRPKNLDRLDLHLPQDGPKVLAADLTRLKPVEAYTAICTLRVPYSALDFNGHVNNTEYVRWALDAIHQRLGSLPDIHTMQLTYLAEVFAGDEIDLLVAADGDGCVRSCTRRSGDGPNAFLMEIG